MQDRQAIEKARAQRDTVLAQVATNNADWMSAAVSQFKLLELPEQFTGEDIRFGITASVGEPQRPQAWGAFVKELVQLSLIKETGALAPMRDKRSHARRTMVYKRA